MKEFLNIAINAAIEAGNHIMYIYDNEDFEIDFKEDKSPLTKADIESHEIICSALMKTEIPVLSEEGKDIPYNTRKNWDRLWIVDPIDGTKEFIKKNGEFTVNIALVEHGVPILGVIYVPALKKLYYSSKDKGSFIFNDCKKGTDSQKIFSDSQKLPLKIKSRNYTVVASKSHRSEETDIYIKSLETDNGSIDTISKGSSLKICMVAEGSADCYPRFAPTMEWDTAAGHAIAKYAGKKFIDWETKSEMTYNRQNLLNNWFLVN